MRTKVLIFLMVTMPFWVFSQHIAQTVKGKVYDEDTRQPLIGATVLIIGTDPPKGGVTDVYGEFRIENVPVGRHQLRFTYVGYEPAQINELMVGSGKEVVLNIALKESLLDLEAVEITAASQKDQPINQMASLSARQLSVEEANRYAGGFDDPSRLAGSFAGTAQSLGNNGIIIRGNAPKGMLWQMEGVQISNPTHFANYAAFGAGGITALSSQVLANSDFFTGAFPGEYGNALSGVFDLSMRTGNPDKREYTFQAGGIGLDFSSEGPFVKGKRASYLFNYRYSTFALLTPLLPKEAGVLEYQDLSFKTSFPTKKAGTFTLWGLGALDYQGRDAESDKSKWEDNTDREQLRTKLFMGVAGLSHNMILSKTAFMKTTLAVSGNGMDWNQKRLSDSLTYKTKEDVLCNTWNYSLSSYVNKKFGPRHTNKTGFTLSRLNYDIDMKHAATYHDPLLTVAKDDGFSYLYQIYSQSNIKIGKKWEFKPGFHAQYFALNGNYTIEPRASLKWNFKPGQSLAVAYGLHAQLELISFYLAQSEQDGMIVHPNEDMDFSKAHHIVLAYQLMLNEHTRLQVEAFYQRLFDIPVKPNSPYSIQNIEKEWIINDKLVNEGEGENFGVDITLERFLSDGFYYLATASLFDSKYKGGDEIWRNARFNKNYVLNLLAGKEWMLGKGKNKSLGVNARLTIMGGDRYDPLLWDESMEAEEIVYDETRAFEEQKPLSKLLSFSVNYRNNHEKYTGTWSLSVLNALGQAEFNGYDYNSVKNIIEKDEDVLMIPNISYKIEF